jgi:hypothetical protein
MKRTFSNKRVARKIGNDDDEDGGGVEAPGKQLSARAMIQCSSNRTTYSWLMRAAESVVKKPSLPSKTKKSSKLRLSFGPGGGTEETGEGGEGSGVATPRKSLGRQVAERNAERKTLRPAVSSEQLSFRAGNEDRPSYSKDSLAELKLSTPSTPKDVSSRQTSEDEETIQSLDLTSKFGATASRSTASAIPTQAEITEKKERRARLAAQQDSNPDATEKEFISLNASDSDEERRERELLIRPKEKYAETRLVREDEDLAEGFDEYVEDGKIALGRKAEREERRRKRREMEELIKEAEAQDGEEDENDSEVERNEAYEAAQTRAGTYGTHRPVEQDRPRTPPKITPVPDLNTVLARMRTGLQEMRDVKAAKERRLQELAAEKKDIKEREVWIQAQLKEVGERYEKLRVEAGMTGVERGLETFGGTPVGGTPLLGNSRGATPGLVENGTGSGEG